jgi:hypothetical protein
MSHALDCHIFLARYEAKVKEAEGESCPKKRRLLESEATERLQMAFDAQSCGQQRIYPGSFRPVSKSHRDKMGTKADIKKYVEISHTRSMSCGPVPASDNPDEDWCDKCGTRNKSICAKNATTVCMACGESQPWQNTEAQALDLLWRGTSVSKGASYSYKKANHMLSTLMRIQAKEPTVIPEEVLEKIRAKMRKLQLDVTNPDHLTPVRVREILKENKLPRYYANVHLIRYMLTGYRPPQMTEKQESDVMNLFNDVCSVYEKLQAEGKIQRSNMLSYNYVLLKALELLGYDEFFEAITLLKHRERLQEQEHVWKAICEASPRFLSQELYFSETVVH